MNRFRSTLACALPLVVLSLCALAPRMAIVCAPRADLYGEVKGGVPNVAVGEALARGNIAGDVLDGSLLPYWIDYQYAPFFGGALPLSMMVVPSFMLFGRNLFALKLVPIVVHLVGVWLLYALLRRYVSRRSALVAGILYALSPPGFTLITTVAWGSHLESNTLAIAYAWLALVVFDATRWRWLGRLCLGVLAGFSLYWGYQCALFVAAVGVLDVLRWRKPRLVMRELGAQLLGFVIGFSPWLVYNLRHDFSGLQMYGDSLGGHVAKDALTERLASLAGHGIPGAVHMPESGAWSSIPVASVIIVLGYLALGLAALLCAWAFVRDRERLEDGSSRLALVSLAYIGGFTVVYALSDFRIGGAGAGRAQFPLRDVALPVGRDRHRLGLRDRLRALRGLGATAHVDRGRGRGAVRCRNLGALLRRRASGRGPRDARLRPRRSRALARGELSARATDVRRDRAAHPRAPLARGAARDVARDGAFSRLLRLAAQAHQEERPDLDRTLPQDPAAHP